MTTVDDTQVILRTPAVDETGGLEVFLDILDLRTKRDAAETVVFTIYPDPASETIVQPAESPAPGLLRRTLTRVKAGISKAVATVRAATRWLHATVSSARISHLNPKLITRFRNRFFGYKGTHHVRYTWYGRQRSTASAVAITRDRHMRAQRTSRNKEGVLSSYFALPEYWVSHMAVMIEVIRDEQRMLHPAMGRHWQCS